MLRWTSGWIAVTHLLHSIALWSILPTACIKDRDAFGRFHQSQGIVCQRKPGFRGRFLGFDIRSLHAVNAEERDPCHSWHLLRVEIDKTTAATGYAATPVQQQPMVHRQPVTRSHLLPRRCNGNSLSRSRRSVHEKRQYKVDRRKSKRLRASLAAGGAFDVKRAFQEWRPRALMSAILTLILVSLTASRIAGLQLENIEFRGYS